MKCAFDTGLCPPHYDEIALVIVTCNPEDSFIDRVKSTVAQFRVVIIVDNTVPKTYLLSHLNHDKIQVIFNEDNFGLGDALNVGCRRALELGFKWVVTLDQDTELLPNYLAEMCSAWAGSNRSPAILGCNYYNVSKSHHKFTTSSKPLTGNMKTVITSGCLTHLPTWSYLGEFRGDYFIDSIDHEFCLRARRSGYCVAVNFQSLMTHTIGEKAKYQKFLKKFSPYTHDVWRVYTRTRNTTRTIVEYATSEPVWCVKQVVALLLDILAIIFLESQKTARLNAFLAGLVSGLQNKMGMPHFKLVANKAS